MVMNKEKAAAHALGQAGEDAVATWYRKAGYIILERNWRCFEGEIDIIARRGRTIVVCEVKTRRSGRQMDPSLTITPSKQSKVRTAAYRWLDEHDSCGRVRFDVALVVNGRVQIIEGAF
ncbi:MAG: putative endonuclease [Acidimicrobiales bacterium]|jgi:putative endonuclease